MAKTAASRGPSSYPLPSEADTHFFPLRHTIRRATGSMNCKAKSTRNVPRQETYHLHPLFAMPTNHHTTSPDAASASSSPSPLNPKHRTRVRIAEPSTPASPAGRSLPHRLAGAANAPKQHPLIETQEDPSGAIWEAGVHAVEDGGWRRRYIEELEVRRGRESFEESSPFAGNRLGKNQVDNFRGHQVCMFWLLVLLCHYYARLFPAL